MIENTKNQVAWQKIFDKYKILEHIHTDGYFEIKSSQINEFREARLMTKFDTRAILPDIFKDNKLSILPISRGSYIISQFEAYQDVETLTNEIIHVDFPSYIESIDYQNINSEAIAINCAFISGIFSDFIGDPDIVPTINGRMSSDIFEFVIHNYLNNADFKVNVTNSQIEIDGGYEGTSALMLLEAKNSLSDDFLVRQLYYPFRCWNASVKKTVKTVFMTYSNSIFSLYEYAFEDPNHYNSLKLVKQRNYSFEDTEITLDDVLSVFNRVKQVEEPEVPFPQADNFKRVINLCELLDGSKLTLVEIAALYSFDERQSRYYTDVGRYLGLIDKIKTDEGIKFFLTNEAKRLLKLKYKERQLLFIEKILSHQAFYETFKMTVDTFEVPHSSEIVKIMKKSNLYNVKKESTFKRRSSSIIGWVKWILDLIKE